MALAVLVTAAEFWAKDPNTVLVSGILGILVYIVINGLGTLFEKNLEHRLAEPDMPSKDKGAKHYETSAKTSGASKLVRATGKAGFFLFLYLEVLDASFSFDGVIGAFAITSDPIIIALGLGLIGAMFVRSITIYLVKKGSLNEYVYLEHGAHWAIGALAIILIISIGTHVNELITGTIGILFIGAAFGTSIISKRRHAKRKIA